MRPQFTRLSYGNAGQQTYRTAVFDVAPSTVTVGGAAATFTSAVDPSNDFRSITITAPAVTQGAEIRMTYDGLSAMTDLSAGKIEMTESIESGLLTVTATGTSYPWGPVAVGNYSALSVTVGTNQTNGSTTVEVTNDPLAVGGWVSVRGINVNSGAAVGSATATGGYVFDVAGFKFARVKGASGTAGSYTLWCALARSEIDPDISVQGTVNATQTPPSGSSGALSPVKVKSAASTNATLVKNGSSRLFEVHLSNTSASVRYLKLFNLGTAPVPGTSAVAYQWAIPAGGRLDLSFMYGLYFATGIGYALTAAVAETDATAIAADEVIGALLYN